MVCVFVFSPVFAYNLFFFLVFFFKEKTAIEVRPNFGGSEMVKKGRNKVNPYFGLPLSLL